jgi:hypothetical protein
MGFSARGTGLKSPPVNQLTRQRVFAAFLSDYQQTPAQHPKLDRGRNFTHTFILIINLPTVRRHLSSVLTV